MNLQFNLSLDTVLTVVGVFTFPSISLLNEQLNITTMQKRENNNNSLYVEFTFKFKLWSKLHGVNGSYS